MKRLPHPHRSSLPGQPAGFSLVEFVVVAFILAVGLLGLGGMQVATARAEAAAGARQTALNLAEGVLEMIQAEAGRAFQARCRGLPAPRGDCTGPAPGPWLWRFDRNGLPVDAGPAFFTVTVTRSAPAPGFAATRLFRASVGWAEQAARPGRLASFRLLAY